MSSDVLSLFLRKIVFFLYSILFCILFFQIPLLFAYDKTQGQRISKNPLASTYFIEGFSYAHGLGLPKNPKKALDAYTKAIALGYAPAQYNAGRMYLLGLGVEKNETLAVQYITAAAEQGLALALYTLGSMYEDGICVAQDAAKARSLYQKAAENGDAESQFRLGLFFEEGIGGEKNPNTALVWYTKAAEKGSAPAQNNIGVLYETGWEGVAPNPGKAVLWYHKAAVTGYAQAQYNLAQCYERGFGVQKDKRKAAAWMRRAKRHELYRTDEETPQESLPDMRPLAKKRKAEPSAFVERTLVPVSPHPYLKTLTKKGGSSQKDADPAE